MVASEQKENVMTVSVNMAKMLESFRETILRYIDEEIPHTVHDYVTFNNFRSGVKTYLKTLAELADKFGPGTASEVYVEILTQQRNIQFAVEKYYNEIGITVDSSYEDEYSKVWSRCTHKMSTIKKLLESYYLVLFAS
jgi:phage regulator Rha-like protein